MIPSSQFFAKMVVQMVFAGLMFDAACGAEPPSTALEKLQLSLQSGSEPTAPHLPSSTQWRGREYDVESGIDVLMEVGRDPETSAKDRQLALLQLGMLRTHLNGRPCLNELSTRFNNAGELEKQIILTCFKGSRDPRAIPLFVNVLDNEESMKLRLSAASGLAGWNVRRGIAELVRLLDSEAVLPQPARMPYVRHNASESFRNANARKDWGFPYEDIGQSIGIRTDLNDEEKAVKFIAEIKKWFIENERRFPDWNPGDPLPEVENTAGQGGATADGDPEKAPWRKLKHLSWSINELVTTADLIVEARLELVDKFFSFGHRCLVMNIERTISGRAPGAPTYLAAPPPADARGGGGPAILFPKPKYLLFLVHDGNTAKAASELGVDPENVFAVAERWKGAIVLEVSWPEVCNRLLENRGLLPPELRRGAEPSEDTGRTTIQAVQDMVAYRQPVPEGDLEASAKQQAALDRLRASQHPWARDFIQGMAKTDPD